MSRMFVTYVCIPFYFAKPFVSFVRHVLFLEKIHPSLRPFLAVLSLLIVFFCLPCNNALFWFTKTYITRRVCVTVCMYSTAIHSIIRSFTRLCMHLPAWCGSKPCNTCALLDSKPPSLDPCMPSAHTYRSHCRMRCYCCYCYRCCCCCCCRNVTAAIHAHMIHRVAVYRVCRHR